MKSVKQLFQEEVQERVDEMERLIIQQEKEEREAAFWKELEDEEIRFQKLFQKKTRVIPGKFTKRNPNFIRKARVYEIKKQALQHNSSSSRANMEGRINSTSGLPF